MPSLESVGLKKTIMGALILVYALLAFGFILCFIGRFPGQVLAYAGMLVAAFAVKNQLYPVWMLVVCGVLVVASIILNKKYASKIAEKVHEFGKAGKIGTTVGSIISTLCLTSDVNPVVGIILFIVLPFVFAFLFESIAKKNAAEGAKRAAGAYTLFSVSTLVNLAICVFCLGEVMYGWIG